MFKADLNGDDEENEDEAIDLKAHCKEAAAKAGAAASSRRTKKLAIINNCGRSAAAESLFLPDKWFFL